MNTRFDQLVSSIQNLLKEDSTTQPTTAQITVNPETVQNFKDSVLVPMLNKQPVDPAKMQDAIKAGVIEDHGDSIYTVTDPALQYVNKYPDMQGKFLPSQQAAAEQKRLKAQNNPAANNNTTSAQNQPPTPTSQSSTTAKATSKPSTNQAGVVSSVYKMQ